MSSLLAKKAVAELKRKNNRVEFLVPNQDGLTIFYGKIDEIVDRMQMLEERQKMLKAVEEDEARLEAERAKAKAEEEARMEAAARAKAKAEEAWIEAERVKGEEARVDAERIRAFIVSQMTFLCLCQDDSCNDDHPMENGELKRA